MAYIGHKIFVLYRKAFTNNIVRYIIKDIVKDGKYCLLDIKDILEKPSNLKRHMNNHNDINSQNNQVKTTSNELSFNLFSDDKDFSFVYKKTERMVTAIYMITNYFEDNEPLKWKLRNNSGELLSEMIKMRQISQSNKSVKDNILNTLSEMLSMFTVAHYAGIVSDMNFKVLQSEFVNLINAVTQYANASQTKAVYLDKDFFGGSFTPTSLPSSEEQNQEIYKGHDFSSPKNKRTELAHTASNPNSSKGHIENNSQFSQHNNVSESQKTESSKTGSVSEALKDMYDVKTASDVKKTSRRSLIINTIRKKGKVMIKDLTPVIKGCSAKTIQRELGTLVEKGILKKEGERRWSTYSIV